MEEKKPIKIDYDIVDNATDAQVIAFCEQYGRGDPDAIRAVELYTEAAKAGDTSAAHLLDRMAAIAEIESENFYNALQNDEPEALKLLSEILEDYKRGEMTPGGKAFVMNYTSPAKSDIDRFILSAISDPTDAARFLEELTPKKLQALIPWRKLTPQEETDLAYTREELRTLKTGSDEEKAQVKAARRERAKHFLSGLTMGDFVALLKLSAPKPNKTQAPQTIPEGEARSVNGYVMTKDVITKAVFGEPGRDGKILSIVRGTPGSLRLGWTTGRGKTRKEVIVYTRLELDRDAMKAAGLTVGKNLSKCAREVFAAMLSHALAGNMVFSLGMLGELIFNTRSDNLTDAQRKYLKDGVTEVFLTSQYLDTTTAKEGFANLKETQNIEITDAGQLFPGHFTTVKINGNETDGIELYKLPMLYTLQDALAKGQILRVPAEYLAIPGRTDDELITIRAYLLRRIDAMKHSGSLSRMILFKNILSEVGVDTTDRAQRNRPQKTLTRVERVLDYWKKEGYINDYRKLNRNGAELKKGAALYEIQILL